MGGVLIILISSLYISCTKEKFSKPDSDDQVVEQNLTTANLEYNNDFELVAKTVAKTLHEKEFRRILKKEALKQYTGDYEINFAKLIAKDVYSQKSSKKESIKNLLTANLPAEYKSKSNASNLIDSLSEKYPHLQISIPVECENWKWENFYPTVVYVPNEFEDGVTETVPGFKFGTKQLAEMPVDAINDPNEPHIVVGEEERVDITPKDDKPAPPTNLSGTQTSRGIKLSWDAPFDPNTTHFKVFRKSEQESIYSQKAIVNAGNRTYDDNSVSQNQYYDYYIVAANSTYTSSHSNYVTILAPEGQTGLDGFEVTHSSPNYVNLTINHSEVAAFDYFVVLKKENSEVNFSTYATGDGNDKFISDIDIEKGKKYLYACAYRLNADNEDGYIESDYKTDFVRIPYRNIDETSSVYTKAIHLDESQMGEYESWINGKPEFYIQPTIVRNGQTIKLQRQKIEKIPKRSTSIYNISLKITDWDSEQWFDIITFDLIEYDRFSLNHLLTLSSKYSRKPTQSEKGDSENTFNPVNPIPATLFKLIKGSVNYSFETGQDIKPCGFATLNFYEPVNKTLGFSYGIKIELSDKSL